MKLALKSLLAIAVVCSEAKATWVVPETIQSLSKKAPLVVYGYVAQIEVHSQTGRRTALVEALDVAKSPKLLENQKEFLVELTNRGIPRSDLVEIVSGAPELKVGEEVVLYLRPATDSLTQFRSRTDQKPLFVIEGFHQGKLRVFRNQNGVRQVWTLSHRNSQISLTPEEIKKQTTTQRVKAPVYLKSQDSDNVISLDSVLSQARNWKGISE